MHSPVTRHCLPILVTSVESTHQVFDIGFHLIPWRIMPDPLFEHKWDGNRSCYLITCCDFICLFLSEMKTYGSNRFLFSFPSRRKQASELWHQKSESGMSKTEKIKKSAQ
jgi:hypothetical protein